MGGLQDNYFPMMLWLEPNGEIYFIPFTVQY